MLFNSKFILASTSTSRFKILKNCGLFFSKVKPFCEEGVVKKKLLKDGVGIKKISLELARVKSKSVSEKLKNNLVVGSDTVIDFKGRLLEKAKDLNDAKKKIKHLSGKSHTIYSSASAFYNDKEVWRHTQKSTIKIRKLSAKEIDAYLVIVGKDVLNSVGCYQAEVMGPNIVEEIKGDFFNVMGFPLFPFLIFLKSYKE